MVLNQDLILEEERNLAWLDQLTCSICCGIPSLKDAVISKCSHVYCHACLSQWHDTQESKHAAFTCPTCTKTLNPSDYGMLEHWNPLAYRMFGSLQIRCPIQNCNWKGHYSELQNHLTNSEEHTNTTATTKEEQNLEQNNSRNENNEDNNHNDANENRKRAVATSLKEQGNERFREGRYQDSIALFNKAITIAPRMPELYLNRAAAYLKLKCFRSVMDDCKLAINLNPNLIKAYVRLATAEFESGALFSATETLRKGIATLSENGVNKKDVDILRTMFEQYSRFVKDLESSLSFIRNEEFGKARQLLLPIVSETNAPPFILTLARVETELGFEDRAIRLTLDILRHDSKNAEALGIRAKATFYQGTDLEKSLNLYREAIKLAPDYNELVQEYRQIKNLVQVLTNARRLSDSAQDYQESYNLYLECLKDTRILSLRSPLRAEVLAERGNALFRLGQYEKALEDCEAARLIKEDCRRAWLTTIYILTKMERFDEALQLSSKLMQTWGGNDPVLKGAHEKNVFNYRRSKRPDYYAILGVDKNASEAEIKRAYRAKSMFCHPDKIPSSASEEEKKNAQEMFHLLGDALEYLTDPLKRKYWDEGYDAEAIKQMIQRANQHGADGARSGGHHHP